MLENFFGEEIEKTVFLSAAQMREARPGLVRGKYFKDTAIFNIFPPELSDRGEFLGRILPEALNRTPKVFAGSQDRKKFSSISMENRLKRNPMNCTRIYFPATKVFWKRIKWITNGQ